MYQGRHAVVQSSLDSRDRVEKRQDQETLLACCHSRGMFRHAAVSGVFAPVLNSVLL